MSWLIAYEEPEYRYTKTRYLDREFGIEYTKFENQQIHNFAEEHRKPFVEITGYVSWLDKERFLLLPTKTVSSIYFICKIQEGVEYPSNNQYVSCKGKWTYSLESKETPIGYKILNVEEIQKSDPDFGLIKPEITHKDFLGILFERWINVDDATQNLIAQTLVSSPTTSERSGGLTLSLFNLTKERLTDIFRADIRRFIPSVIRKNQPLMFDIHELGIKHSLPSFGWSDHISNFDSISNEVNNKLNRIPLSNDEYSISLLSDNNAPKDFNAEGLVKSDYPIILEEHLERKHSSYDTDPEIFKYLIATHMIFPTMSRELYEKGLSYSRDELLHKINTNETLPKYAGSNQLLDLGIRGRPFSILNLTTSYGRSYFSNLLSLDDIKNTTNLYLENIDHVTNVWKDLLPDKINPLSSLSNNEKRVLAFLINNGPCTINDGMNNLKMKYDNFSRIITSLYYKHAIYQYDEEKYAAIWN